MATRYFSAFQRGDIPRDRPYYTPSLPSYSSAVREKIHLQSSGRTWLIPMSRPFSSHTRRIRLRDLSPSHLPHFRFTRVGRRRGFCRCLAVLAGLCIVLVLFTLLGTEESHWTPPFRDSTLVFDRQNLQRIWKWEIESGHYPSNGKSEGQRASVLYQI
jgi:DDB1- and CUL4-associated factor 13